MQPAEHIAHGLAGLRHGLRLFDRGLKLVVHSLPVEAAQLGIPVRIAHRLPDLLERCDVESFLSGRELAGGELSAKQNKQQAEEGAPSHVVLSINSPASFATCRLTEFPAILGGVCGCACRPPKAIKREGDFLPKLKPKTLPPLLHKIPQIAETH